MKRLLRIVCGTTPIVTALFAASACQDRAPGTVPASVQRGSQSTVHRGSDDPQASPLDDTEVAAAVEREISHDPTLDLRNVDVRVKDGVVVLKGKVRHLLAVSRIGLAAASVKGVRAVDNQLKADVPRKDDATLRETVLESLALDPTVDRLNVDVEVNKQVVTLLGTVQSQPERAWADRDARGVVGVRDVKNLIEVRYPKKRTDAAMRGDILGRLRWDQMLSNGFILVKVKDARVSLSGYVGTLGQKLRAEREAWIPGVKDVSSDDLQVKWWDEDEDMRHAQYGDYTDQEITAAIKRAFSFDPRLNGSHITPAVFGGIATLTGTAVNLRARQTAQQIAQDTVGVERVTSSVRVAGGETLDAYLRHKVRKALSYNPITESQDIDVDVHLGRVSLTGTVNGLAAKAEAKRLAQTIAGVRAVDNEVTVTSPPPRAVSTWADTRSSLPLKTDLEIQGDIRHGLESSLDIRPDQIDVRVVEGVATLKGEVDSVRALREAEAIAYGAGAVETVDKLDIA